MIGRIVLFFQDLHWRAGTRYHWLERDILTSDGSPSGFTSFRALAPAARAAAESYRCRYLVNGYAVWFELKFETRQSRLGRRVHVWLKFGSPFDQQVFASAIDA